MFSSAFLSDPVLLANDLYNNDHHISVEFQTHRFESKFLQKLTSMMQKQQKFVISTRHVFFQCYDFFSLDQSLLIQTQSKTEQASFFKASYHNMKPKAQTQSKYVVSAKKMEKVREASLK